MISESDDLIAVLNRLGRPRVVVVGDVVLDDYWVGRARPSRPQAPGPALAALRPEMRLGGAANVAHLLTELRADVSLAGVVGADAAGARLRRELKLAGIDGSGVVVDDGRPTTVKHRILGGAHTPHAQQMLRIDYELCRPLSKRPASRLNANVRRLLDRADVLLAPGYDKGVC